MINEIVLNQSLAVIFVYMYFLRRFIVMSPGGIQYKPHLSGVIVRATITHHFIIIIITILN